LEHNNLASRQVRHIGFIAPAEAVAFLSFLATKFQAQGVGFPVEQKIDLHPIRAGHAQAHLLSVSAHVVVAPPRGLCGGSF
jgi:hypothetical protein